MSNRVLLKIPLIEPVGRPVGAASLFRQMADDIDLVGIVNRMLRWDARPCRVSPGERILLLVLDLLSGTSPLFRVADRLASTDVAVLIGAGRQAADFTDDSLGRALDKLHRAEPAKVFSTLTMQAYAREGIAWRSGHFDTTSRTVQGDFAKTNGAAIHPAYGHSKDHRPDLKQILFTWLVKEQGVPLFGTVASGNQSDKTRNATRIDRLAQAFEPDQLQEVIYVADSALVTGPNLARLAAQHLRSSRGVPTPSGWPRPPKPPPGWRDTGAPGLGWGWGRARRWCRARGASSGGRLCCPWGPPLERPGSVWCTCSGSSSFQRPIPRGRPVPPQAVK